MFDEIQSSVVTKNENNKKIKFDSNEFLSGYSTWDDTVSSNFIIPRLG